MHLDASLLARLQFAFTISFHIIFPAFTIGLSAFIATLLVRFSLTGQERFRTLARFWTKIFAVSFAMGVVSGIVLSYEFGTNFSRFSVAVGNTIGPLIGYEVIAAFFLEATFLGVMLFGWTRVPVWLHTLSAIVVAVGTLISAFWILSANSWMQFPTGHEVKDGIAYPLDWLAIVFNPTFPLRFAHMVTAAFLTTSVVVLSVGARYLLAGRFPDHAYTMIRMGLGLMLVLAPLQLLIGDAHGLKTAEYQPTKLAAMEGHWEGGEIAPLVLFAWPDQAAERNDYEIGIPHLGSLIITHDWNGKFPGLKDVAPADRPPLVNVFFGFRAMVGIGFYLIALAAFGGLLWLRGTLFENRFFLRLASLSWPLGFLAIISGWIVTESGRQPWLATGIIRTVDAISPLPAVQVLVTLILFVVIYTTVFGMGVRLINKLINKGPQPLVLADEEGLPNRPISGSSAAVRAALPEASS
ncbi:cytochrome bd-I ubiquinol oxidase subunit 1 apoprotein [Rhizobiales bacterium GAS191]|nr:cytochrome bd-I ubiquinol oxidase subunit 1 apoprotein [Rhizobiales bacterium GAS113]SED37399.1 cytochrome bd-I ubiquinol oxidase subunit 1 apoprotein [Rhizobiales bacterium GAS188]SEE95307.1 cytochrome bd-I ubiquinol oxidase subunit 1 apoprotein [Rhizobiales bacterium GAS191]